MSNVAIDFSSVSVEIRLVPVGAAYYLDGRLYLRSEHKVSGDVAGDIQIGTEATGTGNFPLLPRDRVPPNTLVIPVDVSITGAVVDND